MEESVEGVKDYVSFKQLLATCREFMGDEIPAVEPKPDKLQVISQFRLETPKERVADYIPVTKLIKSAMLISQNSFFGTTSTKISEQPVIPISVPDKKSSGRMPVFHAKYYKTEDVLQHMPKKVQADANSLFTDKKIDNAKPVYIPAKTLANIGAAAERSLMAVNYFEFFALVQRKALAIVADRKASSTKKAAAMDIMAKITVSMGKCLEDVTRQQAYILTSTTVTRRDAILHDRQSLPGEVSDWLRAQPILIGPALFGPVANTARPLIQQDRERRTQDKYISSSRVPSHTSSRQQQPRQSTSKGQSTRRPYKEATTTGRQSG
jgi:hypothetical protein